MTRDRRRKGDTRPFHQDAPLLLTPEPGHPFRWLPRHGHPLCIAEWLAQNFIKALAFFPVYTAVIVTIILALKLTGH